MFAEHAQTYLGLGLSVIPCQGKKPILRWEPFQDRLPQARTVCQWAEKYPNLNIGAVTGQASGITVVDVDAAGLIRAAIGMFGDTPLKVTTPRGGMHLYYKYNGERTRTAISGLKIDVRAQGGFIVLPPSINNETGRAYLFQDGDYHLLQGLPQASLSLATPQPQHPPEGGRVSTGARNTTLFHLLKENAFRCDTIEALTDSAYAINNLWMSPSLPEKEVLATTKSIWGYKMRGCLVPSGTQYAAITAEETDRLKDKPPAHLLLTFLKQHHEGLRRDFYAAERALAEKLGWDRRTVREAIKVLLERKMVELVHRGGKGKGDPSIYRFPAFRGQNMPLIQYTWKGRGG